jgi:hypothetical protein
MAQCSIGEIEMINPWLSLSLRTARLELEAENAVVDSLFRMADAGTSHASETIAAPEQVILMEEEPTAANVPAESRAALVPKAMKVQSRTRRKRRKNK